MANNIDWGKIYESTNFGNGRTDNTIDWGIVYKDLGGAAGGDGLLDTYSGAVVAYSLRKLRNDYEGNAIRVTPDGSTFTDIGFDGSGNLDTASLPSDSDLYVSTWYDQAASNNLVMTSLASMPVIKSSGSVIEVNSKPAVSFATGREMRVNSDSTPFGNQIDITSKNLTHILVTDLDTDPALREYALIGGSSSNGRWQFRANSGGNFTYQSGAQSFFFGYGGFNVDLFDPNIFIVTHGDVGGNVKFYQNAENPKTNGTTVNGTGQHQMWRIAGSSSTNVSTQKMAEYILFNVDYDSSVSDINTAVNDYYGTYTA